MATFGTGDYQYEVVEGWGMIPQLGLVSGVACDSNDRVYVYNRSPQPAMLVFEADGTFLTEWGKDIFQKPHGIRHTVLRWDAQAQMNMVAHRMPFQQPNPFLFAQIPQDSAYRSPQLPVDDLPAVFRNEHHMILAFPTHMRQTLEILHTLFLPPNGAFPGERAYANSGHAGTA